MDIESYSKRNKVSIEEATKAFKIQANKDEVIKIIEDEYKGRIAGIYVENTPSYKIIVRLKGNGKNEKKEISLKKSLPDITVPVEFIYGAKETKEAAKGQIDKAQKLAQQYFKDVQTVGYNEATGNIDIKVKAKSNPDLAEKTTARQNNWKNPNVPLNVIPVNWSISPMALAYGGTPIVEVGVGYCTTAYGVKDSSGAKYMSTAAHCPDNFKEEATGVTYNLVNQIKYEQGSDLQWNRTSSTITNQFKVSPTTTRTVTGRRTLAYTKQGDDVCHYGRTTGFSCGTVEDVGTSISDIDPKNGWMYPGNHWVKVSTPSCGEGDSGGPAFTAGTIASGIVSLQMTDDVTKQCVGYLYLPTDKIYEQGLSLVY